jgi:exonuclease III
VAGLCLAAWVTRSVIGIASLNVNGLGSAALRPFAERAAQFCRWFEESGVEVVNLQEVWTRGNLAVLRSLLPAYTFLAWRRGVAGQPAGGLATFSRVPLRAVSYRSFRGVRVRAGGPLFRARLALNTRLQGVLTVELDRVGVVVGNVHLTANRDGDWCAANRHFAFQRAQLALMHEVLRHRGGASPVTVLSGDFNISSTGPLYPLVVDGGGWHDPFAAADVPTFHQEFLPPGRSSCRIDYLLVHGAGAGAAGAPYPVAETAVLFANPVRVAGRAVFLSDHCGLVARIALTPASVAPS